MTTPDTENTKQRLLLAALRAFADNGFSGASIREICADAGANIAAVNYHFSSKESLYRETVKHYIGQLALPEAALNPVTPLESLQAYYHFHCLCALESNSPLQALVRIRHREEVTPSGVLDDFWKCHFMTNFESIRSFISDWCEGALDEARLSSLVLALLSLPTAFIMCRSWIEPVLPQGTYSVENLHTVSEQLAQQAMSLMSAAVEETLCV